MKKHLLLIGTLAIGLLNAQSINVLNKEFAKQNKENTAKFDTYVTKRFGTDRSAETLKIIEEERKNLAGFVFDLPYFY